jgi:ATP-dependent protease HslVU (ClpYQ) ATPase subunit
MSKLQEQVVIMKQLQTIARIFKASKGKIRPHFILTGPSGSGKSFAAETLAEMEDIGFLEINAAQLTKEGTAGNSLSKALAGLNTKTNQPTIVFVDEFDKLFISGNNNSELAHETTNGVQNEFLKVLESKTTAVFGDYGKYVNVDISNVLFIFAGAFNGEENLNIDRLRDFGVKVEFLGRVGLVYNMPKLSLESMQVALETSPVLENYLKLFTGITKGKVVDDIMPHVRKNYEKNTLGIRMINTLLHQYFINGGKLEQEKVDQSTFQTMNLEEI